MAEADLPGAVEACALQQVVTEHYVHRVTVPALRDLVFLDVPLSSRGDSRGGRYLKHNDQVKYAGCCLGLNAETKR